MNLLSILNTGGVAESIVGFWVVIGGWMLYQAIVASKSGGQRWDRDKQTLVYDEDYTPIYEIPQFWYFVTLTVIAAAVLIFIVAPDYKGV